MADNRLINYIKANLANGANEEQIRKALSEVGWADDLVNEAFDILNAPKEDEFPTLPSDEPIKESRSAKLMWMILVLLVTAIIITVVLFVVMNSEGKKVGEAKNSQNSELQESGFVENEEDLSEEKIEEELPELSAEADFSWKDGEAWEVELQALYESEDDIADKVSGTKTMGTFSTEEGNFYLIKKEYGEDGSLYYLAYRGAIAKCFLNDADWDIIYTELKANWSLELDNIKTNAACSGNFLEEPALTFIKEIKIPGLNIPYSEEENEK